MTAHQPRCGAPWITLSGTSSPMADRYQIDGIPIDIYYLFMACCMT